MWAYELYSGYELHGCLLDMRLCYTWCSSVGPTIDPMIDPMRIGTQSCRRGGVCEFLWPWSFMAYRSTSSLSNLNGPLWSASPGVWLTMNSVWTIILLVGSWLCYLFGLGFLPSSALNVNSPMAHISKPEWIFCIQVESVLVMVCNHISAQVRLKILDARNNDRNKCVEIIDLVKNERDTVKASMHYHHSAQSFLGRGCWQGMFAWSRGVNGCDVPYCVGTVAARHCRCTCSAAIHRSGPWFVRSLIRLCWVDW